MQYSMKFFDYFFVLWALYKVICVIANFASYLLIPHTLLMLTENAILAKAGAGYTYSEDVLSLSMMPWSIGRYRNYGNVMRANWRILWESIKTRLLSTEVEYYISDIQEIGYRRIPARSLLPPYKKDQEIIRNII